MKRSTVFLTAAFFGAVAATVVRAENSPVAQNLTDCWLEHAQVQPPPTRVGGEPREAGGAGLYFRESRLGAEHPTPDRLRPCSSLRPQPGLESRPVEPPDLFNPPSIRPPAVRP